jgi:hypothetical protein
MVTSIEHCTLLSCQLMSSILHHTKCPSLCAVLGHLTNLSKRKALLIYPISKFG